MQNSLNLDALLDALAERVAAKVRAETGQEPWRLALCRAEAIAEEEQSR